MIDLTQLEIDRLLGAGSQGKVFLATDPGGGRFTVKLVTLDDRADREGIFERAAQFRADLLDPSMVPILSYGMVSATPPALARQLGKLSRDALVLVMPFVTGTTLAEIEAGDSLTLAQGVAALAGIATALARLPKDVAHGDVRTPNVFIRPSGDVALSDPELSTPHANPADDVRALAAIASSFARAATLAGDALAIGRLEALFDEMVAPGPPITVADAAHRFGEIAVLLGAPPGNVTSVLAKLVRLSQPEPRSTPTDSAATKSRARSRRALEPILALALTCSAGFWLWTRRPRASASGESLYDTTGSVHYDEVIHRLGAGEKIAAGDGLIQIESEDSIARVAILSPRKDILWELKAPPAGGTIYFDAKPGHYEVEQDRNLGAEGLQRDVKLAEVDRLHPLRVTTTREIVNSPHRPEQ